ncbi:hypothetical protein pEaSNUABM37_00060 [Erwinia phage pEa_SNUABM_37]|nr:hypothetical protein pEaSNUABM37_00060 [Erwinia phage pEa_SNUABM_37]QXO10530.1 hypothetical protein pEaSNUABM48_00060 [Erwinia phage pEa_SNUABM_48]
MTMSEDKEERLAAIDRMKIKMAGLQTEAKNCWDEVTRGQHSISIQHGHPNQLKKIQDLQAVIVKATQADNEAKEIQRFIDRAVQTYVRDYPQFGRGILR